MSPESPFSPEEQTSPLSGRRSPGTSREPKTEPGDEPIWDADVASSPTRKAPADALRGAPVEEPKVCSHCGKEYSTGLKFCPDDGAVLRSRTGSSDLSGQIIAGRYHVLERLGEGGMGDVYLAEHVRMRRQCAVKVLHTSLVASAEAIARFEREAASASQIAHPNVVAVYDFGEAGEGVVYLAMEYVRGESLSELLAREESLPPRRTSDIVQQVSDGIAAAHELRIVHRDLKPANIMVGKHRDGRDCVKVVDFGIAKALESASDKLTATGLLVGTPAYMSPEQLSGDPVDARSDIYSLGLVAFHLLTGTLPFAEGQALLLRLVEEPRTLAEVKPGVQWPAKLQVVFDRVLSRDPGMRYQSVEVFRNDFSGAVEEWLAKRRVAVPDSQTVAVRPSRDSGSHRSSTTIRWRKPIRMAAIAAVVLLSGASVAIAFTRAGFQNRSEPATLVTSDSAVSTVHPRSVAPITTADDTTTGRALVADTGSTGDARRPTLPLESQTNVLSVNPSDAPDAAVQAGIREDLDRLKAWTDASTGNEASAGRALVLASRLLPRLTSAADTVEAQYYAATAHLLLDDRAEACRLLRSVERKSISHPFLARAVAAYLTDPELACSSTS